MHLKQEGGNTRVQLGVSRPYAFAADVVICPRHARTTIHARGVPGELGVGECYHLFLHDQDSVFVRDRMSRVLPSQYSSSTIGRSCYLWHGICCVAPLPLYPSGLP